MTLTSAALAHHADRRALALALVGGGRRTTYRELQRRVGALAAGLRARGVGPGDVVALLLGGRVEAVEAAVAVDRLGATRLWLDPALRPAAWGDALDRSGARTVLCGHEAWPALVRAASPDLDVVLLGDPIRAGDDGLVDLDALLHDHAGQDVADVPVDPGSIARLVRADDGTLRGLTRAAVDAGVLAQLVEFGLTAADRVLLGSAPPRTDPLDAPGVAVLQAGGSAVLADPGDPVAVLHALEADRATVAWLEPDAAAALVALDDLTRHDLRAVRLVLLGGSAPPPATMRTLRDAFPHAWLAPAYAPPEAAGSGCVLAEERAGRKAGSVGRGELGLQVSVVDGEVVLGGPQVAGGELGTGDRGRLDDEGFLFL